MRRARVTHSRFGFHLEVYEVPSWAFLAEELACRVASSAGKGPVGANEWVSDRLWRLANAIATACTRRERVLFRQRIPARVAASFPEWTEEADEMVDSVDEWGDRWVDGMLWDATCPRCGTDFASVPLEAADIERLDEHMSHCRSGRFSTSAS